MDRLVDFPTPFPSSDSSSSSPLIHHVYWKYFYILYSECNSPCLLEVHIKCSITVNFTNLACMVFAQYIPSGSLW